MCKTKINLKCSTCFLKSPFRNKVMESNNCQLNSRTQYFSQLTNSPKIMKTHHLNYQKNLHIHIHTLGASSVTPSSADTWVLQSREDCTPEDIFGPKPHLMEELGLMLNEPKDTSFRMCTAVRDLELEVGLQIFCLRCRSKVPLTEAMAAIDAAMADNDMQHSICPQQGTISSLQA